MKVFAAHPQVFVAPPGHVEGAHQPERADGKGRAGLAEVVGVLVAVHQALVEQFLLDAVHGFVKARVNGLDKAVLFHEQQRGVHVRAAGEGVGQEAQKLVQGVHVHLELQLLHLVCAPGPQHSTEEHRALPCANPRPSSCTSSAESVETRL